MPPMLFSALMGMVLNMLLAGVLPERAAVFDKLDGARSQPSLHLQLWGS